MSSSLALRFAGAGFSLLFSLIIARRYGAEGAGLYFLAFSIVTVLGTGARLGLDQVLLRFTAALAAVQEWAQLRSAVKSGSIIASASLLTVSLILAQSGTWLSEVVFRKPALDEVLLFMALSIVPFGLLNVFAEVLKGLQRIVLSQFVQVTLVPGIALIIVIIFDDRLSPVAAAQAYLVAALLGCVTGATFLLTAFKHMPASGLKVTGESSLLSAGLPLMWFSVLNIGMTWSDTIILGIFRPSDEVGVYGAASRLAMLINMVLLATRNVTAPAFAAHYKKGEITQLQLSAIRSGHLTTAASIPLAIGFIAFPSTSLGVFGTEFQGGHWILVILTVGQLLSLVAGPVGQVLAMSGNEVALRNVAIKTSFFTLGLHLVLTPQFGGVGAAVATACSVGLLNLLATRALSRCLGISVHVFSAK